MSIDLIDRIQFLKKRGNEKPFNEVFRWISENEIEPSNEFINNGTKYYWKIISSVKFKEIIDEDLTEWFLIFSADREFRAISKIHIEEENFVGKKRFGIRTIWILKSGIDTIKINEKPTLIWTPHLFERPLENINYDFGKLFSKLKDPKVKITEFILDPKSRIDRRRIR